MRCLPVFFALLALTPAARAADPEPVTPTKTIKLFNGKDLSGLSTWLRDGGKDDPNKVFSVADGMIHVSGEGAGYVRTDKMYANYHLIVEYKWGEKTDGSGIVRNSGLLVNARGLDGGAGRGAWMHCLEIQLAQGCEGDFILIRGKNAEGQPLPAGFTSDVEINPVDKKTRWKRGGTPTKYNGRQFWWNKHDPTFKEKLDTHGRWDVASKLGEWTKVECICDGSRLTVKINDVEVNECYDLQPASGYLLLQNEGNEIYFRRFELHPLKKEK